MKKAHREIIHILTHYGPELSGQGIVVRSGVYKRLKRGIVYVHLDNMERAGLVSSREIPVEIFGSIFQGWLYKLTDKGKRLPVKPETLKWAMRRLRRRIA